MSGSTSWKDHVDTRTGTTPPRPDDLSELDKLRKKLGGSFKLLGSLAGASLAAVPDQTGDGSKLSPEDRNALYKRIEGDLQDMTHLGVSDVKTLIELAAAKLSGEPVDDKTYLMEGMIRTAAKLPDDSKNRVTLTNQFLTQLWNDLQHPPLSYLGAKYQYRSADGSFNSLVHKELGAAGTPYARTVKPAMMQTPALPDAGVVFDSVMTRKHRELHPNRISSVLFYLASIIIHDCFRTDHADYSNSLTSSYLDLSPLYGSNQVEQDEMRTFVDGRLKPDCFSEARLLFFPPGVGCLLIMFNRFHNHVVDNLARINEGNRFPKPKAPEDDKDEKKNEEYKKKLVKYDNDLFQTGRLITCGLYVNIILIDYVRTILDLNRTDSNWQLNPRAEMKDVPMGVGNQVSAEFNLVYRWHSTVSDRDEKWTQELWDGLFGKGRDPKSVEPREFLGKLGEVYKKTDKDPSKRSFAGLKRNEDGTLPDQPIVDILVSSIEDCANSFGPNRVPEVMRAIEVLGIEQSRSWNLCSLNEFRKYFGLEPHRSFDDITSDKYVAEQLKHLYDHPDKVEIYPGIVVEDAKKPMCPGSGLTPSYTVSRAVLSDAVALVRGDRFYTLDYNPRTMTNWGFRAVDYDTTVDNGCSFYKLFLNAFPQHFKQNSVYVHYPLTIPSAMKVALEDLDKDKLYNFDKPTPKSYPHPVREYKTAVEVLKNQDLFRPTWGKAVEYLTAASTKDAQLTGDAARAKISQLAMSKALYVDGWEKEVRGFYASKTRELLAEKSQKIAVFNQIDIIRDVGNLANVHFAAELFMLPLKTDERPHGLFTEADLHLTLSAIAALLFQDIDPVRAHALQVKSRTPMKTLAGVVEANVRSIDKAGILSSVMQTIWPKSDDSATLKTYGKHLIHRLLDTGLEAEQIVWGHILGTAAGLSAHLGQLFAQMMEFFLVDDGKQYWPKVQELANQDTESAIVSLERYVLEATRLNGEAHTLRSTAKETTLSVPTGTKTVKAGDTVFVNLHAASNDEAVFPKHETLDLTRPLDSYIHLDFGPHGSLIAPLARVALTTMLKEVAKLKGLRPAKGPQGKVHKVRVKGKVAGGEGDECWAYLTEMWDGFWMFPCALKVNWDN
ncbi:heme peroxidase [Lentithecium fluviatile CBS 122367]|uniref:Heme peroxidase n=1 Tax=Lentithecium fluviatile CBS 122367 TaxID=1168545 RepID=A0A6G1JHI1_9PLEO|nr:heme peroxidase [Lentithecium fluviatile CBS 122367]